MNWINNFVRPKIRSLLTPTQKREIPDGQWITCPESGQMVFYKDLEANQFVVPGSGYHWRMNARQRLAHTFDDGAFQLVPVPAVAPDPLKFRDAKRYIDRIKDARAATDQDDAVLVAEGRLNGLPVVAAAQDFTFMAGSLGMAAGEAVIAGMLRAVELGQPFILFAASGGARMQEGILSLMQMPRTTIAVQRLREARLPYIVVLTDPTSGGVTASYAMLGDIHIAEPNALICFAGPRVIQQTIREQLPEGFQRSEYLLAHGMVDMVVHRHQLRQTLTNVCRLLMAGVELRRAKARDADRAYATGLNGRGKSTNGIRPPEPSPENQAPQPALSRDGAAPRSPGVTVPSANGVATDDTAVSAKPSAAAAVAKPTSATGGAPAASPGPAGPPPAVAPTEANKTTSPAPPARDTPA